MRQRTRSGQALVVMVALAALHGAPATAQEGQPPPEGGVVAPTDPEVYAQQLVAAARTFAAAEAWGKTYRYLKYAREQLAGTQYVTKNRAAIDHDFHAAEDKLAEAAFGRVAPLVKKRPDKAWERLQAFQKDYGSSAYAKREKASIDRLATELRTQRWPGKTIYRGKATLPADGVLELSYRFDSVAELADFEMDPRTRESVQVVHGALGAKRRTDVIRHGLVLQAAGHGHIDATVGGRGKLQVVLSGEETKPDSKDLVLELDLLTRSARAELRGGPHGQASVPRQGTAPLHVQVDVANGQLKVTLGDGDEKKTLEAPARPGSFRVGLLFRSGHPELDALAVRGALPDTAAVASKKPLPSGVWIPLHATGMDGWVQQGTWSTDGKVIRQEDNKGRLVSKELDGRVLDAYELRVDVRVVAEGRAWKANKQPYLCLVVPFGEGGVAWTFTPRQTMLEGADARRLVSLAPNEWCTLTARLDRRRLECVIGRSLALSVPVADLVVGGGRAGKLKGFAVLAIGGRRRIELRDPKIKLP